MEKKVEYLLKSLSNFTKGREKLETLLGSQNVGFNKNELGYNPGRTCFFSFSNLKSKFVPTCFYCMKSGHTSRMCKWKNYLVPKG